MLQSTTNGAGAVTDIDSTWGTQSGSWDSHKMESLIYRINEAHESALAAASQAVQYAHEAGLRLLEAKAQVGHGGWGQWVERHCNFSKRTAQDYMRVAQALESMIPQHAADFRSVREILDVIRSSSFVKTSAVRNQKAVEAKLKSWLKACDRVEQLTELLMDEQEGSPTFFTSDDIEATVTKTIHLLSRFLNHVGIRPNHM